MSLVTATTAGPFDSEGREWGSAERPMRGFLDGWAMCESDHIHRTLYGEETPCPQCEDET